MKKRILTWLRLTPASDTRSAADLAANFAKQLQDAREQIFVLEAENQSLARRLDMETLDTWIAVKACLDAAVPGHDIDRDKFDKIYQPVND